jgi:hypothetical protein
MLSRTNIARGNETYRFSPTYTLSDFPLLIGEILRRSERRSELRARRRLLFEKIKRGFCSSLTFSQFSRPSSG